MRIKHAFGVAWGRDEEGGREGRRESGRAAAKE